MHVVIISASCFILLATAFGVVFAGLISRDRIGSLPADLETLFSPIRYRVMERLLKDADQKFIASHPACTPQLEKNLRKNRIRIFRGYMRMLSGDFSGICKAIKFVMVRCKTDRSDLAAVVMKQQFLFAVGMMHVEFRLILYGFGWSGVDANGLVHALDAMRTQLQSLAAVAVPSAA